MITVEELQDRSKLDEGRDYGVGFTILKKLTPSKYETYLPYTACKDYLNDVSYVMFEKKPLEKVHGFKIDYVPDFETSHYFYLGVNALHYLNGSEFNEYDNLMDHLQSNHKSLESILNGFEKKVGLKLKTSISLIEDGTLILKAPKYWLKKGWLISAYTLIIRYFVHIDFSKYENLEHLINSNPGSFIKGDNYYFNNIKWFYQQIGNIDFLKVSYDDLLESGYSNYSVHGAGIKRVRDRFKYHSPYFNKLTKYVKDVEKCKT